MELIHNYNTARKLLLEHIGFTDIHEDYPIIDCTGFEWKFNKSLRRVEYAVDFRVTREESNYYFIDYLMRNKALSKVTFEGKELSGVLIGSCVDNQALLIFSNAKHFKYIKKEKILDDEIIHL